MGWETNCGTYLVCSEQPGVVTEYDLITGKVVWEHLIKAGVWCDSFTMAILSSLLEVEIAVEVTPDKKVVGKSGQGAGNGNKPKVDDLSAGDG